MQRLLLVLLVGTVSAQVISYPKAYNNSNIVQAGPAPFTASDLAGTCKPLPAPYAGQICRLTDPATKTAKTSWTAGVEQASVTNQNGTLIALTTMGSFTYIYSFNPATMKILGGGSVICAGSLVWDVTKAERAHCFQQNSYAAGNLGKADGKTVYALDFAKASLACGKSNCYSPDNPVWTKEWDLATCPLAGSGTPKWAGMFTIGANDEDLLLAINWDKGGQNTGHLFFDWKLRNSAHKCTTYDTQGNGISPLWYTDATPHVVTNYFTGAPLQATWFIHEARTIGLWAFSIGFAGVCNGADCGKGDGPIVINATTHSAYGLNNQAKPTGGHNTNTATQFINADAGAVYKRFLATPTTIVKACTADLSGEDIHFSGDLRNDTSPVLATTGKVQTATWTKPYMNEIIGCDLNSGIVYRFSPTWSSGPLASNFNDEYGMTTFSQQRDVAFLTSDMLCGLDSACRSDIFAIKLQPSSTNIVTKVLHAIGRFLHITKA